tara:strand:- start:6824 stop:7663 length:840 start_codon:yes stop_codon:yes gene_type:complete
MVKRILIPTDFSKNALNAARYAIDLYSKLNCDFYFLNVFQLDKYTKNTLILPEPGSTAYDSAEKNSKEEFVKLLDMLSLHQYNPKHTYHTISSFSFLIETMVALIDKNDIDFVVMGTKGATGAKGVIFGSNTVNAMEKIRMCPVLAVPENISFSTLTEIVFPTNYKNVFKRKEMSYLIEIAKMQEASIEVLHITKEKKLSSTQEENKQLLDEILDTTNHSFHHLSETDISEGITAFVESRGSSMIAFINRKHFFFGSVFSNPLVKEIGYKASTPILALH